MKKIPVAILLLLIDCYSFSQSTKGITGTPDTSYTIHSAYAGTIKTNPEARLANEISFSNLVEEKDISYCRIGDRKLLLDVFYAKQPASSKRTAIIIIHGGGWRSGNRTLHYPFAKRLAKLGYVCFTPEYRLSTEALYPAGVYDIKASIRWVRRNAAKYNLNEDKIVVAGHSAGGELAAMMGATNGMKEYEGGDGCNKNISSKVNAVIDIDGTLAFIHPESGEGDDSKRISAATNWFGYSKTENPELWKQGSPLTHVGPNSAPTLFINSNVARMHAGQKDFIDILFRHDVYSQVRYFNAPHSFILFDPWLDSSAVYIDKFLKAVFSKTQIPKAYRPVTITVAQDGTGHYKTIQEAFNAIPANSDKPIAINVKEGIYKEKLFLDSNKPNVQLLGSDKFKTIITYNDHTGKVAPNGDTINTRTSWTFLIKADNFTAYHITFQNDAGFTAGQAVAVESDGDKASFLDCRFIGNQDVLFLNNEKSRQYFWKCYIEGTTDFIFGSATAWFDSCEIYSKKNSHVTAASTPQNKEWGFVFNACKLTGDTSLHNVSLGRPWRPYAAVVYMNCYIGAHIKPEGWSNWNNTENYKTTRYAEYKNYGPSSDPTKRVNWSRQLTNEEAKAYDKWKYLNGWLP